VGKGLPKEGGCGEVFGEDSEVRGEFRKLGSGMMTGRVVAKKEKPIKKKGGCGLQEKVQRREVRLT